MLLRLAPGRFMSFSPGPTPPPFSTNVPLRSSSRRWSEFPPSALIVQWLSVLPIPVVSLSCPSHRAFVATHSAPSTQEWIESPPLPFPFPFLFPLSPSFLTSFARPHRCGPSPTPQNPNTLFCPPSFSVRCSLISHRFSSGVWRC